MPKENNKGITVQIRIVPNSSKNEIIKKDGIIKVKITAQPVEGKANKALTEYLAKLIKIPKTSIKIIKGETSKDKLILFETTNSEISGKIKNIFK